MTKLATLSTNATTKKREAFKKYLITQIKETFTNNWFQPPASKQLCEAFLSLTFLKTFSNNNK